jgi:hypothetical protein
MGLIALASRIVHGALLWAVWLIRWGTNCFLVARQRFEESVQTKVTISTIQNSVGRLPKIPVHIGAIFNEHSTVLDYASFVAFSVAAGIRHITLYDRNGSS